MSKISTKLTEKSPLRWSICVTCWQKSLNEAQISLTLPKKEEGYQSGTGPNVKNVNGYFSERYSFPQGKV